MILALIVRSFRRTIGSRKQIWTRLLSLPIMPTMTETE